MASCSSWGPSSPAPMPPLLSLEGDWPGRLMGSGQDAAWTGAGWAWGGSDLDLLGWKVSQCV